LGCAWRHREVCRRCQQAGWRPLIHSRIGHESRARVFMLALLLSELGERAHEIAVCGGALQLLPGRLFREHELVSADFESQLGAFRQVECIPYTLRYCDLSLGRHCNYFHILILPLVRPGFRSTMANTPIRYWSSRMIITGLTINAPRAGITLEI